MFPQKSLMCKWRKWWDLKCFNDKNLLCVHSVFSYCKDFGRGKISSPYPTCEIRCVCCCSCKTCMICKVTGIVEEFELSNSETEVLNGYVVMVVQPVSTYSTSKCAFLGISTTSIYKSPLVRELCQIFPCRSRLFCTSI